MVHLIVPAFGRYRISEIIDQPLQVPGIVSLGVTSVPGTPASPEYHSIRACGLINRQGNEFPGLLALYRLNELADAAILRYHDGSID